MPTITRAVDYYSEGPTQLYKKKRKKVRGIKRKRENKKMLSSFADDQNTNTIISKTIRIRELNKVIE